MNAEDKSLPDYALKYVETPKIPQEILDAINKTYDSMWKSDFIDFGSSSNFKLNSISYDWKSCFPNTIGALRKSSPCAEAPVEQLKPGHVLIQLLDGEEYAPDHKESD